MSDEEVPTCPICRRTFSTWYERYQHILRGRHGKRKS